MATYLLLPVRLRSVDAFFCFAVSRSVRRRSLLIQRPFFCSLSFILQLLFSEILLPFPFSFLLFPLCSSLKFCLLFLFLSCSLSRCSSVKLHLLSLSLSCSLWHSSSVKLRPLSLSLSRCSSVKFCLLSLALCCSRSR